MPIDQKTIARNSLMLYLRMGLMLIVGLFTTRVVIDALGDVDFGLYNAIGGIVAMFSFLSGTMATSCQRFYMIELGKGEQGRLRDIFNLTLLIFALFALIVLLLSETLGLWLLHDKMVLSGREQAANWVFQCSVVTFMFGSLRIPFQGMVIARERMNVFAYISVFEALAALGIAMLLQHTGGDHLIEYAILMMGLQLVISLLYALYCWKCYPDCRFRFFWEKEHFVEIFSFAGWNLIGSLASVLKLRGTDILINMFFGPVVNAARGVAFKVSGMVSQLQENFMTASKPQIIKSYSAGDHAGMSKLVYQSSKYAAFLMLLFSVPMMLEMPFLLGVWLKEVPQLSALFAILMVSNALIDCLDYPLWLAIQAVGKIRTYQIVVGSVQLLILPISYLLFKFSVCPPETVIWVSILISLVCIVLRVAFARALAGLRPVDFVVKVLVPVAVVALGSTLAGLLLRSRMESGWLRLICVTAVTLTVQGALILSIGMTRSERDTVLGLVRKRLHRGA